MDPETKQDVKRAADSLFQISRDIAEMKKAQAIFGVVLVVVAVLVFFVLVKLAKLV